MIRTQWRSHQRKKKSTMKVVESSNNGKSLTLTKDRMEKKPMWEIIYPPLATIVKPNGNDPLPNEDDEILTGNFDSRSENNFDVICKKKSVLPIDNDRIIEVTEEDDNEHAEELANYNPLCYYIMNNSCVDEYKVIFERPDLGMQQHLKPFFI